MHRRDNAAKFPNYIYPISEGDNVTDSHTHTVVEESQIIVNSITTTVYPQPIDFSDGYLEIQGEARLLVPLKHKHKFYRLRLELCAIVSDPPLPELPFENHN